MYDVFVFSLWTAIYSVGFAIAWLIVGFGAVFVMGIIKHQMRYETTIQHPEIFGDMQIVSFKMRAKMVYLMRDRAERRFAHLNPMDSESMSVDNSRDYYLYGKGTPPKYLENV
jgi:hypothetical protein